MIKNRTARTSHGLSDDKFATVRRSVDAAPIPVPLLLSNGKFPVRFGRYEILSLLGEGQMGSVFLGRDRQLNRQVAIKVSKFGHERETIDRFSREARIMANMRHPNICPVYDTGELDGTRYFVMPYIAGVTLADRLDQGSLPSNRRVAMLIRTVALALDTAHKVGVVHRDLKPANIIINPVGEPVITDFGLARSKDGGSIVTKNGVMLGTPAYMPPEQVLGDCDRIGPPSDLYSLGVVMYQMLAGRIPFNGKLITVFKQIISDEPLPPSHFNPAADRRLEAICLKAMTKSIEHRFRSAVGLADALREFLPSTGVSQSCR